jgi:hypothetical protein
MGKYHRESFIEDEARRPSTTRKTWFCGGFYGSVSPCSSFNGGLWWRQVNKGFKGVFFLGAPKIV